jgi:hypothetical protein
MWNQRSKEDAMGGSPTPNNMATYREAVDEFTRNATALIGHIPLFTKAREAYEQAMRASEDLREVLDTGDQTLRALMAELEQAVSLHLPAQEKRKSEPLRIDAINAEGRSILAANG